MLKPFVVAALLSGSALACPVKSPAYLNGLAKATPLLAPECGATWKELKPLIAKDKRLKWGELYRVKVPKASVVPLDWLETTLRKAGYTMTVREPRAALYKWRKGKTFITASFSTIRGGTYLLLLAT